MSVRNLEREVAIVQRLSSMSFLRLKHMRPVCLSSVESTQSYLVLELRDKSEGDFVLSVLQTKGRGREGRSWSSDEGGLYLSMTLVPKRPEVVDGIARMATNAIMKTLASDWELEGCSIKKPNDVFCKGKKIAGVLVDAELKGIEAIAYLGIGVDLNNGENWDKNLSEIATSYYLEKRKRVIIDDFLINLLWRLDVEYNNQLKDFQP